MCYFMQKETEVHVIMPVACTTRRAAKTASQMRTTMECRPHCNLSSHRQHAVSTCGLLSRCMACQVGDGTTTVVILAGELLRECKAFVEEGVHPQARPLLPWSLLLG